MQVHHTRHRLSALTHFEIEARHPDAFARKMVCQRLWEKVDYMETRQRARKHMAG